MDIVSVFEVQKQNGFYSTKPFLTDLPNEDQLKHLFVKKLKIFLKKLGKIMLQ